MATLVLDSSSPAIATNTSNIVKTVVSPLFTPPNNSLIVALWSGNATLNNNPGTPTIVDSALDNYTLEDWQSRADTPTADGQAADWAANVTTGTAMTVTVTSGTAASEFQSALAVQVFTGHNPIAPIGSHGKGGSKSASAISQSFVASATGSWGYMVVTDWDSLGSMTAGTGCTLVGTGTVPTTQISYGIVRRTTADGVNGNTTTLNINLAGSSTNVSWTFLEIVPDPDPATRDPDPPPPFLPAYLQYQLAGLAWRKIQHTTDNGFPNNLIDNSSPVVVTTVGPGAATSGQFNAPPGAMIIVGFSGNNAVANPPSVPTITDSLGTPLTYTLQNWQSRADSPTVDGQVAIWTATSTGIPMTISVTGHSDASNSQCAVKVWYTLVSGCTVGAKGKTGSASASSISQGYTALATGGQGVMAVCDWTVQGPQTVTSVEVNDGSANIGSAITYGFLHRFLADDVNTVSNTLATTLPSTSNNLTWTWLEILPPTGAATQNITPLGIVGSETLGLPAISRTIPINGITSNEIFGATAVTTTVTINANGITSSELSGSSSVAQQVSANGIISSETFGTTLVAQGIVDNSITTSELFGNATISMTVPVNGIPTSETSGASTVTVASSINANNISTSEQFGAPAVSLTVFPSGLTTSEVFGNTLIAQGIVDNNIPSSETFGNTLVAQGVVDNSIPSAERFGAPTITTTYTITANGIPTAEVFGSSNTVTASSITPSGISTTEQFGAPAITTTYTINANGIPTSEAFGSDIVTLNVTGNGIPTSERFGAATLSVGISDNGIISNEIFGSPAITSTYTINANGIPSSETFGSSNTQPATSIIASAIASAEVLGAATVSATATISAAGVPSAGTLGSPTISLFIVPGGITSSESSGASTITSLAPSVNGYGIPSSEQFGSPSITLNITPGGIVTSERSGFSTINTISSVNPGGITSAEAFGNSPPVPASINYSALGIPTPLAVGLATVTLGAPTLSIIAQSIVSGEKFGYPHTGASVVVDVTSTLAPENIIFIDEKSVIVVVAPSSLLYRS